MKTLAQTLSTITATISSQARTTPADQPPTKFSNAAPNGSRQELTTNMETKFDGNQWQQKWLQCSAHHPKVLEAMNQVQVFGFNWYRHGKPKVLVLAGNSGCGKTHMAKHLWRWAMDVAVNAWERGYWIGPPSTAWLTWQEVCDSLESTKMTMEETLRQSCAASLLFVDDAGAESDRFKSGKSIDAFCYLLTRRQGVGHTLITTNHAPGDWAKRWDARVEDRLMRDSVIVDMTGCPSWAMR